MDICCPYSSRNALKPGTALDHERTTRDLETGLNLGGRTGVCRRTPAAAPGDEISATWPYRRAVGSATGRIVGTNVYPSFPSAPVQGSHRTAPNQSRNHVGTDSADDNARTATGTTTLMVDGERNLVGRPRHFTSLGRIRHFASVGGIRPQLPSHYMTLRNRPRRHPLGIRRCYKNAPCALMEP